MRVYPQWLDDMGVMAKSPDMGGQTLVQHTLEVIERLVDQRRIHPAWGDDVFWAQLFWGCLLHDFGKAASGFQDVLRGIRGTWSQDRHRHEVLSLGFVDWAFPKGHPHRNPVIAVIIAHHKDAEMIDDKYGGKKQKKDLCADDRQLYDEHYAFLADQIGTSVKSGLWRWLAECGTAWADELGFGDISPQFMPHDEALEHSVSDAIYKALRDFFTWRDKLPADDKHHAMLYRGAILTSDHSASAGVGAFPNLRFSRDHAIRPLEGRQWHTHQTLADSAPHGHAIMIAPTGSGKTEAAMLWASQQLAHKPASRIFYTLPYQASMNAMANRLSDKYFKLAFGADDNDQVTIQHSRATLKFYQDAMDADEKDPQRAGNRARTLKNKAQLNFYPIQVFSPYQMLKAAYGIKGYEALLLDYTDALFIFDEIHAYDPNRLAMIIGYMGYLATHFRARFLIMTATLPPLIEDALRAVLPNVAKIRADQTVFDASKRHIVHITDGDIASQTERILTDYNEGKAVLVVCNQVKTAQKLYDHLKQLGFAPLTQSGGDVMLLHGRFNGQDRRDKETLLMHYCGVDDRTHRRPVIVIATQVVEVSLNVDFDVLYTEPAPLEALLQRFGRVNRGRTEKIQRPVFVMTTPYGDNYKPYDEQMVIQSLQVLQAHYDGQAIDEAQVDALLAHIYTGDIADRWHSAYQTARADFERWALGALKPFESADSDTVKAFYTLFDGQQVLPVDCKQAYDDFVEQKRYFDANALLVNITTGQYQMIVKHGLLVRSDEDDFFDQVRVDYDGEYGLKLHETIEKMKHQDDASFEDEYA